MVKKNSPVFASGLDEGTVAHFGSLTLEQRELLHSPEKTYAFLPHRGILQLHGQDALDWLHSLTTQDLLTLDSGDSAETLILSPQGRVEHQLKVIKDQDFLWLIIEGFDKEATMQWLNSMIFMKDVSIKDVSEDYILLASLTSDGGFVKDHAAAIWHDGWSTVAAGGHHYGARREEEKAWRYCEVIVEANFDIHSFQEIGINAFEALRIVAGRPRFGFETDDKTLPHELNWLSSAVHLNKGCYRGQETVAKVHNIGHPPRRLTLLHLDGSAHVLAQASQKVLHGDKTVGMVTSSGFHYELGAVALALLKRTVPTDVELTLDDGTAVAQEIIVPSDAGATVQLDRGDFLNSGARKPLL